MQAVWLREKTFANLKFLSYLTMPFLGTKGLVIPRCERVTRVDMVDVATVDPVAAAEDPIPRTSDGESASTAVRVPRTGAGESASGSTISLGLSVGDGNP